MLSPCRARRPSPSRYRNDRRWRPAPVVASILTLALLWAMPVALMTPSSAACTPRGGYMYWVERLHRPRSSTRQRVVQHLYSGACPRLVVVPGDVLRLRHHRELARWTAQPPLSELQRWAVSAALTCTVCALNLRGISLAARARRSRSRASRWAPSSSCSASRSATTRPPSSARRSAGCALAGGGAAAATAAPAVPGAAAAAAAAAARPPDWLLLLDGDVVDVGLRLGRAPRRRRPPIRADATDDGALPLAHARRDDRADSDLHSPPVVASAGYSHYKLGAFAIAAETMGGGRPSARRSACGWRWRGWRRAPG